MSQEFDNNVVDLVKQKGFYPYGYISDFEKVKKKKKILIREKFHSSLTGKKNSSK